MTEHSRNPRRPHLGADHSGREGPHPLPAAPILPAARRFEELRDACKVRGPVGDWLEEQNRRWIAHFTAKQEAAMRSHQQDINARQMRDEKLEAWRAEAEFLAKVLFLALAVAFAAICYLWTSKAVGQAAYDAVGRSGCYMEGC